MPPEPQSPSPTLAVGRDPGAAAGSRDDLTALLRGSRHSVWGRLAALTILFKVLVALLGGLAPAWLRFLDSAGTLLLAVALGVLLVRVLGVLQRRLLWRVRRKLALSYLLVGFVPILLLVSFFLLAGTLMLSTVISLLVQLSFQGVVEDAGGLARSVAMDLSEREAPEAGVRSLAPLVAAIEARYPGASVAVVPRQGAQVALQAGPWAHAGAPTVPVWLTAARTDLVVVDAGGDRAVVARGVEPVVLAGRPHVVVADLPVSGEVVARIDAATGVALGTLGLETTVPAGAGRASTVALGRDTAAGTAGVSIPSIAFLDLLDWGSGAVRTGTVSFTVYPGRFYRQVVQEGELSFAGALVFMLMAIGVMFLTIEAVALVMGFALARSITGAVHELFTGTERVRRGDLDHRIEVTSRDQLGELAESFNAMTGSITDLLLQAQEKRRLEAELRIARKIQMSLLPDGPVSLPGLAVTAVCKPAREVGGDYYDFVPLGDHRLGVLVADVSGKGTSAAFYMAELKGLILALGPIYDSPKRLLMEVNRILADNLDSRTFITMIYAVVDLQASTLTYVRAGHTPLIHVPACGEGKGRARVLIPDGLVVGLRLPGIELRFAELLEECVIPLTPGDLFALYTDGVTEAMNEDLDLFGDDRLARLLEEHGALPSHLLQERILADIEAFVGGADQHDDITMVLLRIEPETAEPA